MWLWHAPELCNAAVRNPFLHGVQSLSLLIVGLIFWWPIVGPDPAGRLAPLSGIIYLFTAGMACAALGVLITCAYPGTYLSPTMPGVFSDWQQALPADQRAGGFILWVPGCLIYVCGILGLLVRWQASAEADRLAPHARESAS
jgi:cytochrome c oxidase assembly factor CtaG